MLAGRPAVISNRLIAGLAIAVTAGVTIGYIDSSPGWDDTGITAVSLLLTAGIAAFVARRFPWLVAVATGIWVPLFELPFLASGGPLAALVFAAVGAATGWLIRRE